MHANRDRTSEFSRSDGAVSNGARCAVNRAVRAGAIAYDRMRDLPALIRHDPFRPIGDTPEAIEAILARLECALRAERNRARSGHWTYDLNRHIALRQAFVAETDRLAALKAGR
jgi:hypothetical protein